MLAVCEWEHDRKPEHSARSWSGAAGPSISTRANTVLHPSSSGTASRAPRSHLKALTTERAYKPSLTEVKAEDRAFIYLRKTLAAPASIAGVSPFATGTRQLPSQCTSKMRVPRVVKRSVNPAGEGQDTARYARPLVEATGRVLCAELQCRSAHCARAGLDVARGRVPASRSEAERTERPRRARRE